LVLPIEIFSRNVANQYGVVNLTPNFQAISCQFSAVSLALSV